ncbi:MAG: glutamate--tRNA ligase [Gammaproteobacteria bacterium]|nr:glutamate--tRNA ligase [Gammaproteobacteria bacterium]MCP5201146.1 glutamate--tRNA ligase [Gammaproteobacteria bacterium]
MTVVTRFPPSPTGYLHIGSARTALYNWLYARGRDGRMVFRLEDTDRERSTQEAVDAILESMSWLGLDYDEGPYYQTQRFDRYREAVQQLLDGGRAYHCYCSRERLDALREQQMAAKEKPRYDGHCRDNARADNGNPPVVRFRTPPDGTIVIDDHVRGAVTFQNSELDDLIIARSDGTPTYHLTVVVDDIDMGVTHVIRGDDHLNNTPRQVHILEALGADRPVYAHIPMINGPDGKKLSKRHGAVSVLEYRDQGILPQALLTYLARLGWSHGDQEIFTLEELVRNFDISGVNKASASFDPDKLAWVNQQFIQAMELDALVAAAAPYFAALGLPTEDAAQLAAVVDAQRTRAKTLVEMADKSRPFFGPLAEMDEDAAHKHLRFGVAAPLRTLREALAVLDDWQPEALHAAVETAAAAHEMKLGKVAQPLRVAVTGGTASPSIDITLQLVGKTQCLERLDAALAYIAERVDPA